MALEILGGVAYQARTGKGCMIDAPMMKSMVSFLMVEQLAGRSYLPPLGGTGYDRLLSPYRRLFKTKDGYIGVLPYNGNHWSKFLKFVDREDIAEAGWIQDPVSRSENVSKLYEIVAETMPSRTSEEWIFELRHLDIPCGAVNELSDLIDDEHLSDVGLFSEITHPSEGEMLAVRSPFTATNVSSEADRPAPNLGEHTVELIDDIRSQEMSDR